MHFIRASVQSLLPMVAAAVSAWSQTGLSDASLEQLFQAQVTSAFKKEQKLARLVVSSKLLSLAGIVYGGTQ